MKSRHAQTFFITGVNGAGKSTLVPMLRKALPSSYAVFDFDQRGVPKNVDTAWRRTTTRYWLSVARRKRKQSTHTVICGLTVPQEILALVTATDRRHLHLAVLDVSAREIGKRIRRRVSTPAQKKKLLAVTQLSLEDNIQANIRHAVALRKDCKRHGCRTFITTHVSPKRTAEMVVAWLLQGS